MDFDLSMENDSGEHFEANVAQNIIKNSEAEKN